ncbi:MAG: hypothetical protein IRZ10_12060 [Thermoflavifilum sp.]|nr:hypothetical protein [Thermoflavifilum sp.]MCL6515134.1 hypothetical protein [Alicyclobacillus sp.]
MMPAPGAGAAGLAPGLAGRLLERDLRSGRVAHGYAFYGEPGLGQDAAAQAWAAMHGRDYVLPDDVKRMAPATLAHRLILRAESQLRGRTAEDIIRAVLEQTAVPLVEEPARR